MILHFEGWHFTSINEPQKWRCRTPDVRVEILHVPPREWRTQHHFIKFWPFCLKRPGVNRLRSANSSTELKMQGFTTIKMKQSPWFRFHQVFDFLWLMVVLSDHYPHANRPVSNRTRIHDRSVIIFMAKVSYFRTFIFCVFSGIIRPLRPKKKREIFWMLSDTLQIAARRCHTRNGRFSVATWQKAIVLTFEKWVDLFSAFSELLFCFGIRSKEHGRRLLAQIQQSLLGWLAVACHRGGVRMVGCLLWRFLFMPDRSYTDLRGIQCSQPTGAPVDSC